MKLRKIASAMLAATIVFGSFAAQSVSADNNPTAVDEEVKKMTVPENLRYENGDIKWDELEDAYGYVLNVSNGEDEWQKNIFDTWVEFDRFCYENGLTLGEYTVKLCNIAENGECSEWTEPITVEFAATLDVPANIQLSEEREEAVSWDEVEGAYRYNVRIYNEDQTFVTSYSSDTSFYYDWNWGETGEYFFSVQTMDKDYNVSEWSDPLTISHVALNRLDTPQNVRLDESGETILWDAVEGAEYYYVYIYSAVTIGSENETTIIKSQYVEETHFDNWKSLVVPCTNGRVEISVWAYSDSASSDDKGYLNTSYLPVLDESINVPEEVRVEDGMVKWAPVEGADRYWCNVLVNGEHDTWSNLDFIAADQYSEDDGVYLDYYPIGDYEIELYVLDKDGKYNKKTYSMTFGKEPDETVWVPEILYKFDDIFWDYDTIRHDNTNFFWLRVKDANDGTVIKLERVYQEHYYDFWFLPNGDYIIDVCSWVWDPNDFKDKVGNWSKPFVVSKHDDSGFDKENETTEEVETPPEAADVPEEDKITSITINPAFNMKNKHDNNVELDLSKIKIKAKEIYDEDGLKRAEEALGKSIEGNKHYNLLDLTLMYNEEDFSNGYDGLVQVIIPIPAGHRDKNFSCFRLNEVDGKLVKEVIPGTQTEDSYIIYLEHFSLYALVADAEEETEEPSEPTVPEEPSEPTVPEEPSEPTESEEPSEPTESEEPSEPTVPEKPSKPTISEEPSEPTDSEEPSESTAPEEPTDSEELTKPEESESMESGNTDSSNSSIANNSNTDQKPTGIAVAIAPVVLSCAAVIVANKKKK